uniref:SCP domain-containing protein n=2 Tax=Oryza brachyantha TaxID=4533 RepID=J3MIC6_ORYBR
MAAWSSSSSVALLLLLAASLALAMPPPCRAQQELPEDYYVYPHNATRALVGVPAVTWNATVAEYAQSYAAELIKDGGCELQSSGTILYGENMYFSSDAGSTAADAVASWASEEQWYDHDTNSCSAPEGNTCGHYTQVVWLNSTDIGCATVVCDGGRGVIITCNYWRRGNVAGESPY